MKVYIAEQGCYEERGIAGVYASPEAAMKAHPIPPGQVYPEGYRGGPASAIRGGGWKYDAETKEWRNGLDWQDAVSVTEYEVER